MERVQRQIQKNAARENKIELNKQPRAKERKGERSSLTLEKYKREEMKEEKKKDNDFERQEGLNDFIVDAYI